MKILSKHCLFLLYILLFTSIASAYGHGGEKHPKSKDTVAQERTDSTTTTHAEEAHTAVAAVDDFPNLHPLVVHFPIVLLILAAIMQLVAIFFLNRPYNLVLTIILSLGFVSAYLASSIFHAHTGQLAEEVAVLFEEHENWAYYAMRIAGLATVLKIISLFLKPKRWLECVIAVVLLCSAVSVAIAGHYGAELVHKHGIGPKGNGLERDH